MCNCQATKHILGPCKQCLLEQQAAKLKPKKLMPIERILFEAEKVAKTAFDNPIVFRSVDDATLWLRSRQDQSWINRLRNLGSDLC
jgi:tRNA(His) 5'-end guanylyltransferase